jgi:hypothetical protein
MFQGRPKVVVDTYGTSVNINTCSSHNDVERKGIDICKEEIEFKIRYEPLIVANFNLKKYLPSLWRNSIEN